MFSVTDIIYLMQLYLKWLVAIFTIILVGVTIYNWRRRWLYYYGSKLPGPFAFPLIGSIHLLKGGPGGVHTFLTNLYKTYPSVFKIWLGPDLYVTTTEPKHLKIILTKFLDKGNFYHLMSDYFRRALAAAPLQWWRKSRKSVNPTFNISLINSFAEPFAKQAAAITDRLEEKCGQESDDLFPLMWKCTLDAACETLAEVDPELIKTENFLPGVFRLEDILMQRFFNPILHLDIFWYFSSSKQELIKIWKQNCSFIQQIIDIMKSSKGQNLEELEESPSSKKRFLTHLIDLEDNKEIPHDYVLEEGQIMFFVGTETSSVALSSTLLLLGMFPKIQEKIDEELFSIFGNSDRSATLEDANRMDYLERVLKESMRLLPPIPYVLRNLDENLQLDSYVLPYGSRVIIPIEVVHRNPEFWPDPLKFDPDRFLPDEVEKRPPCAYIPFSYGIRNCLGYKYGMLSMKIILSTILRRYRIKSSNYKRIEDIDLFIHVIAKAKEGYKVVLEKK